MKDFNHKFSYIYGMPPIDFWEGSVFPSEAEHYAVLSQMPEEPRSEIVHKLFIPVPGNPELVPVFLCKAENNGTVYMFSDTKIYETSLPEYWEVK